LGIALGLSKDWLDELFRFARRPDASLRLKEKKVKNKGKSKKKEKKRAVRAAGGFVEFCCDSLAATSPDWDPVQVRGDVLKYLDALEEKQEILKVGKKLPKQLLDPLFWREKRRG